MGLFAKMFMLYDYYFLITPEKLSSVLRLQGEFTIFFDTG